MAYLCRNLQKQRYTIVTCFNGSTGTFENSAIALWKIVYLHLLPAPIFV